MLIFKIKCRLHYNHRGKYPVDDISDYHTTMMIVSFAHTLSCSAGELSRNILKLRTSSPNVSGNTTLALLWTMDLNFGYSKLA